MSQNRVLLPIPTIFILMLFFTLSSTAQNNNNNCASSSCGDIKISYPFRLRTAPRSCGYDDSNFELQCNNNQTIVNVRSRSYIVKDINYDNYSVRLVDSNIDRTNLSSCPVHTNDYDSWPLIFRNPLEQISISYVHCTTAMNSTKYVKGPFCGILSNSSEFHSYAVVGNSFTVLEVEKSCKVDRVVWISGRSGVRDNSSLAEIYEGLAYGIELSWFRVYCGDCETKDGYCGLEGSRVTCKYYCMESTPLSQQSFKCQFKFWAFIVGVWGGIAVAALVALRFVIGFPLLVWLVVSQWRKGHLPV